MDFPDTFKEKILRERKKIEKFLINSTFPNYEEGNQMNLARGR